MIWKIVIIILCLLWWLPIVYMWWSMKKLKKYEDYLDDERDSCEAAIRAYKYAVKDIVKEFNRLDSSIEDQRKIVNGWQHKIDIMDRDVRKIKNELSEQKE